MRKLSINFFLSLFLFCFATITYGYEELALKYCGSILDSGLDDDEFNDYLNSVKDNEKVIDVLDKYDLSFKTFQEKLNFIWMSGENVKNAATHVLCGDFKPGKIGGLHWHTRYSALKKIGALVDEKDLGSSDEVMTISFRVNPSIVNSVKKIGGFSRTADSLDLLLIGFEAVRKCCMKNGSDRRGMQFLGNRPVKVALYRGDNSYYNKVICAFKDNNPLLVTMYPVLKEDPNAYKCD